MATRLRYVRHTQALRQRGGARAQGDGAKPASGARYPLSQHAAQLRQRSSFLLLLFRAGLQGWQLSSWLCDLVQFRAVAAE
jgi:hypothetical protein